MSSQFLQDCQRFGWMAVLPREFLRRLRWWFGLRCYGIYLRELSHCEISENIAGFSLKIFGPGQQSELLSLAKNPELNLTSEFVHAAMQRGDVCGAIIHDDEIVSFSWAAFVPPAQVEDSVYLDFGYGCRYAYFAYTLPIYRGRHLPRMFSPEKDNDCVARGFNKSISFIAIYNLPSINFATAMGNRRIGFAGFIKCRGVFFTFRTLGLRRYGFRFFANK